MNALSVDWAPVIDELNRWRDHGRTVELWLRDDDLVEVTPALDRLHAIARSGRVPVLMAAIPARATDELAGYFAAAPLLDPAVHGFSHVNHAQPGEKSAEFPPGRGERTILDEIGRGKARLGAIFGSRLVPVYVPPWNRIAPEVAHLLPGLGFKALSTFGVRPLFAGRPPIAEINTHVDIINWKGGRIGRDHAWLIRELAAELSRARADGRRHLGILAHHLAHDETAWRFLESMLEAVSGHPAVRWVRAQELIEAGKGAA